MTAPAVRPATICRLKKMYLMSTGAVISRMSANSRWYWVSNWLWKSNRVMWLQADRSRPEVAADRVRRRTSGSEPSATTWSRLVARVTAT